MAAPSRDLRAMVKAAEFRDDLYYRLSASAINIPPLRERRDALEALAAHFIQHYNRLFDKRVSHISRRALAALRAYEWPGNVREFAHAIQSAIMLTDNDRVCIADLPENLLAGELSAGLSPIDQFDDFSAPAADEEQAPAEGDRAFFYHVAAIKQAAQ